nr:hypothetical protein [uncultured Fusobacterium sp.]
MNKKICEGVKFKINEDKFLMAINKGEVFITSYTTIEKNNMNGKVHLKQIFSYQFDQKFIKNNFKKLEELNILEKIEK